MTPEESLAYLYGLQQFGIKLGLDNIRTLLKRLGSPEAGLRCVHVAGTNGKGSVSALLAEILRHSGERVGLYTSPHLHCFSERLRINGIPLDLEALPRLVERVRQAAAGLPATFFEATTALALLAFREAGATAAVLETGLGGRLDATNAVTPELTVITPVSFDHREHLGATLAEIAAEKAGIIKPGVPVVVGRQEDEARAVIEAAAAAAGAPLWSAGRDYRWDGTAGAMHFSAPGCELSDLDCALAGRHQLANYALALAGAARLRRNGWAIPDSALRRAGATTRWPGRLEWWSEPGVLLDGAHNAAGAEALAGYLVERGVGALRLVTGLSGQRRPAEVLDPLRPWLDTLYFAEIPEVANVPGAELAAWADAHGIPHRHFAAPAAALEAALSESGEGETVVVAGSLYLVAAARAALCAASGVSPRVLTTTLK